MKTLVKLSGILVMAMFVTAQTHAVTLLSEPFTYADGALTNVSGGLWVGHSGAGSLTVATGAAIVSGALAQDVNRLIGGGAHSNDVLYAAFDVTFTIAPTAGLSTYFAHFKDSSTFNFYTRVFGTNVAGLVRLGITTAVSGAGLAVYEPTTFAVGATQRVIIMLDQSGPNGGVGSIVSRLWLNQTDESGPSVTSTDIGNSNLHINVQSFALRQATGEGTIRIDNLVVGTTFSQVPEPSTVFLVGLGLVGLLAVRRRRS